MSTILDALKKSERERTVLRGLGFSDAGWRPTRDIDWLRWVVIGGIAGIALVAAAVLILRSGIVSFKSTASPTPTSKPAAATVDTPVAPAPPSANDNNASPNAASSLAEAAPVPPLPPVQTKIEFLSAMAPEFQQSVPPMTVNIHVFAPDESSRILYINNRPYRRGDEIPGGVRVEEIVPEGVVLQFQGQRFKLAKPS